MSQSTPDFFVCLWFSWQSICSLVFHCFLNGLMTIPLLHFMQSDLWNLLPVNQTVVCRFYEALCTVPKVQNHSYDSTESKYDLLTTSHQGPTAVGRSSSFSVCHHDTAVFHCSFLLLLISSHCVRHDRKPYISRDQWILKGWRGQYHDGIFDFPEHFQVLFLVLGWIDLRAWGKFLKKSRPQWWFKPMAWLASKHASHSATALPKHKYPMYYLTLLFNPQRKSHH